MAQEIIRESKRFYSIFDGMFFRKAEEGETPVTKTITTPKETYIKEGIFVNRIDGHITKINFREQSFTDGDVLFFNVELDGEYIISLNWDSKYAKNLAGRLLNPEIDFSLAVSLTAYNSMFKEKRYSGINVKQGELKLKPPYYDAEKKCNINGLEKLDDFIPKDRGDKDEWKIYFIKVSKFLRNEVETKLIPKFKDIQVNKDKHETVETVETVEEDDLPF